MRVQVRIRFQKTYFFEFKFEFGKMIEFKFEFAALVKTHTKWLHSAALRFYLSATSWISVNFVNQSIKCIYFCLDRRNNKEK